MINKFAYGRLNNLPEISEYNEVDSYSIIIRDIVKTTNCKKYLELGVNDGKNIHMIREHVDKCVGVDLNDNLPDKNNIEYHLMTTDEFFIQNKENFDVIFIDANHDWIFVRRDLENSLKVLNEFGIIFIHDSDPIHPVMLQSYLCSDSYHINDYIYSNHPELDIVTLPVCDMGLTIIKRKRDTRVSKYL